MEKKITVYALSSGDKTKNFTTAKNAEASKELLAEFGIVAEVTKTVKTVNID